MKSARSSSSHIVFNDLLTFEVIPNVGVRNEHVQFDLGLPLNQVLTMLDQNVRIFPNVQLSYSKKNPYSREICIFIDKVGIRLFFDPKQQLLKHVDLENFSNVILKYDEKVFCQPGEEVGLENVDYYFGSTKPGAYDEKHKLFVQSWPGLSLWFPNSGNAQVGPGFSPSLLSLKYEGSAQPKLSKMSIFKGQTNKNIEPVEVPISCYCGQNRTNCVQAVFKDGVLDGIEVDFTTQAEGDNKGQDDGYELVDLKKKLRFGDDVGIVLAALGAPNKVFYKHEDKMSIHRGGNREIIQNSPHFFFNYFTMGLDVLFDFHSKKIVKFVLHANMPGHFDFGIYARCYFEIKLDTENFNITNWTKYPDVNHIFSYTDLNSDEVIKPVISRKRGPNDPFGSTYLYGISQLVIEVMDNNYISQVTLYDSTLPFQ